MKLATLKENNEIIVIAEDTVTVAFNGDNDMLALTGDRTFKEVVGVDDNGKPIIEVQLIEGTEFPYLQFSNYPEEDVNIFEGLNDDDAPDGLMEHRWSYTEERGFYVSDAYLKEEGINDEGFRYIEYTDGMMHTFYDSGEHEGFITFEPTADRVR
tara:strand:- start:147 stop:611 length:465 start_codon:yes stop_codon:yes gene_type:complete